jgi:hypothetical protein
LASRVQRPLPRQFPLRPVEVPHAVEQRTGHRYLSRERFAACARTHDGSGNPSSSDGRAARGRTSRASPSIRPGHPGGKHGSRHASDGAVHQPDAQSIANHCVTDTCASDGYEIVNKFGLTPTTGTNTVRPPKASGLAPATGTRRSVRRSGARGSIHTGPIARARTKAAPLGRHEVFGSGKPFLLRSRP